MRIDTHQYLSPDAVCEMVPGLTTTNLAQRRYLGYAPRFLKTTPKLALHRESDMIAWIEDSEKTRTDDGQSRG